MALALAVAGVASATTVPAGAITADTVWDVGGSPYDVTGTVVVRNDAILTVEAGVEVRLSGAGLLQIGDPAQATTAARAGALHVDGTAGAPVTFVASPIYFRGAAGATRDSWVRNATFGIDGGNTVEVSSWSALTFDNVTFDRSGTYSIYLVSSSPFLNNVRSVNPTTGGVYLSDSSPTIVRSSFTGGQRGIESTSWTSAPNVRDSRFTNQTTRWARLGLTALQERNAFVGTGTAVELWGGNTWHAVNVTLPAAPGVYDLSQWAGFRGGATLTVEPGVRIRAANDATLYVGDPGFLSTTGLRARYGNFGATNTSYRFGPAVSGAGCDVPGPDLRGYGCAGVPWAFTDIRSTGTASGVVCDDCMSGALPIGFPVTWYGRTYTSVYASSNGFLSFDSGQSAGCCSGQALPAPGSPDNVIAGYWEDLYTGSGTLKYQTVGVAPDRAFVLQWTDVPHYCCSANRVTFQIVLYENATHADVNLMTAVSDGGTHVTGIESFNLADRRGRLVAEGTAAAPIVFESLSGSASSGWNGLRFQGAGGAEWASTLRNVTLRWSDASAIELTSWSAITLDRIHFDRIGSYGVYASASNVRLTNATSDRAAGYVAYAASGGTITFDDARLSRSTTHGAYVASGGHLVMRRGVIENATGYGVWAENTAQATLTDLAVRNATQRPARLPLASDAQRLALSGNAIREIEYAGGDLTTSSTLRSFRDAITDQTYGSVLVSSVTVWNGATWTIEPGVRLLADNNVAVQIGRGNWGDARDRGALRALGTAAEPIVLTSRTGATATGWAGVYFYEYYGTVGSVLRNATLSLSRDDAIESYYSSSLVLDNVTLERNARHGLYLTSRAYPTLTNVVIRQNGNHGANILSTSYAAFRGGRVENSTGYGVVVDTSSGFSAANLEIRNSTQRPARFRLIDPVTLVLRGNGIREVEHYGVDVATASVVRAMRDADTGELYPNVLLSGFTIWDQATLTIEPGVRMLIENNVAIQIGRGNFGTARDRGALVTAGTAADPIVLTSRSGATATGWAGLYFYEYYGSMASTLRNTTVSWSRDDGIESYYSSLLALDNVTLERNARHGLHLTSRAYPQLLNTVVRFNGNHGVNILSGSHPTFRAGLVHNNTGYGVIVDNAAAFNAYSLEIRDNTQRPARYRLIDPVTLIVRGNGIREVEHYGWEMTASTTYRPVRDADTGQVLPSVLLSGFTVWNQATWTVEAGARFLAENNVAIQIGRGNFGDARDRAGLALAGTRAEPVTFTSRSGTTATGWTGFYFYDYYGTMGNTLRNATISFSKDDGIEAYYSTSLLLDNLTLERNARYGLHLTSRAYPQLVNVKISRNANHGVLIASGSHPTFRGGLIENSTGYGVWANSDSAFNAYDLEIRNSTQRPARARLLDPVTLRLGPNGIREIEYWAWDITSSVTLRPHRDSEGVLNPAVLLGSFVIYNQATWTIEAGNRILAAENVAVQIGRSNWGDARDRGTIQVLGTREAPVTFTARSGATATGWYGLYFYGYYGGGPSVIRNATFSFSKDDGIQIDYYSALTLDNVTSERNARYGVYSYASSPTLRNVSLLRSGNHGLYVTNGGRPVLYGGLIQYSTGYGIYVDGSSTLTADGTQVRNSTQRPARLRIDSDASLRIAGNAIQEIEYVGVDVTSSNAGLRPHYDIETGLQSPAVLLNSFTVWNGATWRIGPGTHLLVAENVGIQVGRSWYGDARDRGSLEILGTAEAPVTVAARSGTVATGWSGFYLYNYYGGAPNVIRNATISHSKDHALDLAYSSPTTIDNVTFLANAQYPIRLSQSAPIVKGATFVGHAYAIFADDTSSRPTVTRSRFENQTTRHARVPVGSTFLGNSYRGTGSTVDLFGSGQVFSTSLRIRDDATYRLLDSFTMAWGSTLTIDAGVDLLVQPDASIQIGRAWYGNSNDVGGLQIPGTAANPVTVTAATGNATTGWYGFYLYGYYGQLPTVIRNATIGLSRDDGVETYVYGSAVLDNVTFDRNARSGLYANSASPTVRGSTFSGGQYGVLSSESGSRPTITGSAFRNQTVAWARLALGSRTTGNAYAGTGSMVQMFTGGLYSTSVTVSADSVPYRLLDTPTFAFGSTLTLEPGARIDVAENVAIQIGRGWYGNSNDVGTIRAVGTAAQPIVIRSATGSAATGWYGLYLYGYYGEGPSLLRNVTLALSKDDGAESVSYDAFFDNVTFDRNARSGLYVNNAGAPAVRSSTFDGGQFGVLSGDSSSRPTAATSTFRNQTVAWARLALGTRFTDNRYEGTGSAVQLFTVGLYSSSVTQWKDNVDFHLLDAPQFAFGSTLTLERGVRLKVPENVAITIGRGWYGNSNDVGHLRILGTQDEPVTVTSLTGTAANGWYGFYLYGYYGAGTTVIRNATIGLSKDDGIEAYYYPFTIENSTLTGHGRHALLARDRAPTVRATTFVGGATGLTLERAHGFRLLDSTIRGAATGVALVDTDNGQVRGTRIVDGATGVQIDSASANTLLYDNLLRSIANARDSSTTTRWNETARLGLSICGGPRIAGNCWSDYTGADQNGDGIGDTLVPYKVNITGTGDRAPYPLHPWAEFADVTVNATLGLVQYTDASRSPMRPIVNWTWTFGDGSVSYDQHPLHDYDVEGFFNVTLVVRDAAGATGSATRTILLDSLAPVTNGLLTGTRGNAPWWTSNVTITLQSDDAASEVADILVRTGASGEFSSYTGAFPIVAEGYTRVEYFAIDLAGNREPTQRIDLWIDRSQPTTTVGLSGTAGGAGWFTSGVNVGLSATDGVSGVTSIWYRLDGGGLTAYTGAIPVVGTGVHTIDAFATDVAGNLETSRRTTIRIDTTPPVTVATPTGTTGTNGWWRSDVAVAITASDDGSGVATVAAGVDGAALAPYTGPLVVTGEGTHAVAHQATDVAGLTSLLGGLSLKIDTVGPGLSVELAGNRHASGWFLTFPTLYANATDGTSGVARVEYSQNGGSWQLYTGPRSFTTDGAHRLLVRATDLAGNVVTAPEVQMPIDTRPPLTSPGITGTQGPGGWYRTNLTVSLSASDAGSGVASTSWSLDGTPLLPYAGPFPVRGEGTHTIGYQSADLVGWVEGLRSTVLGIDLTKPLSSSVLAGVQDPNGTFTEPVTLTLSGSDGLSGIWRVEYSLNSGSSWTRYTAPLRWDTTQTVHLLYRAIDLAGNVGDVGTIDFEIELDLVPPTTTSSLTGTSGLATWWKSPVDVRLTSSDAAAGVAEIRYRVDGDEWQVYAGVFRVSGDGIHVVDYYAVDRVGNVELLKTRTIKIDATRPATSDGTSGPEGLNGWRVGPTTVTLGALDNMSGLSRIEYRLNGGSWRTYAGPIGLATSGTHVVDWAAFDIAGNSQTRQVTVRLDLDAPVVELAEEGVLGEESWFRSAVELTLDASDPTSGILGLWYRFDANASWIPYVGPVTLDAEGRHRVQYYALDGSGTPGLVYEHQILIDLTTPIIGLELENTLYAEIRGKIYLDAHLCIEVTGLDLLSGLKDAWLEITGVLRTFVELKLAVELQCFDLEGLDGALGIGIGACDKAGNCDEDFAEAYVDAAAPGAQILRPFPGALNVQDAAIPLFGAAFASPDFQVDVEGGGFGEVLPEDEVTVSTYNATLARTTIVAGTRVPVWVLAYDGGNPIDRVELWLDGAIVGVARETQNVTYEQYFWDRKEDSVEPPQFWRKNVTVAAYVFEIDTLTLPAGDHTFLAKAFDLPGNVGEALALTAFLSHALGDTAADLVDRAVAGQTVFRPDLPGATPDAVRDAIPQRTTITLPEEIQPHADEVARAIRILAELYDTLAVLNYEFADENVVRFHGLYELVESVPLPVESPVIQHFGGAPPEDPADRGEPWPAENPPLPPLPTAPDVPPTAGAMDLRPPPADLPEPEGRAVAVAPAPAAAAAVVAEEPAAPSILQSIAATLGRLAELLAALRGVIA